MSLSAPIPDQIQQIDSLLPQTQCGKCGFDGCLPYAKAIVEGEPINQCPPGGPSTVENLARLLNQPVIPLNPKHGLHGPRLLARIRESECIGCTKCIQACPLDAILGAAKLMHTVMESQCSGCDLCVDPCPVDCIDLIPASLPAQAEVWRQRFAFRQFRLNDSEPVLSKPIRAADPGIDQSATTDQNKTDSFSRDDARKKIADAVARVKARKAARNKTDENL